MESVTLYANTRLHQGAVCKTRVWCYHDDTEHLSCLGLVYTQLGIGKDGVGFSSGLERGNERERD